MRRWLGVIVMMAACGKKPAVEVDASAATTAPAADVVAAPAEDVVAPSAAEVAVEPQAADVSPVAAGPAESILWYTTATGVESAWIRATEGDGYEVLATRAERVVAGPSGMLALRFPTRGVPTVACPEDFDDEPETPPGAPVELVQGLEAVPLGDGERRWLVSLPDAARFVGHFDRDGPHVLGSMGAAVAVSTCELDYSCGAYPEGDCGGRLIAASNDSDVGAVLPKLDDKRDAVRRALLDGVADPDCKEHFADIDSELDVLQVGFAKTGARLAVHWTWVIETDTHAYQGCEPELDQSEELGVLAIAPAPSPAVKKALLERGADGPFGIAAMTLSGDARAAAFAAFADASTLPTNAPIDRGALDQARALMQSGKHAEAIAAFDTLILAEPTNARAWSGRGYAQLLAGALDSADDDLRQALEFDKSKPFEAAVRFNLGTVAERKKDRATARAEYRRSFALAPNATVQAALAALGTPSVRLGPTPKRVEDLGNEDLVVTAGFPAVSEDGTLVVHAYAVSDGARGLPNLRVEAWSTKDGKRVFQAVVLDMVELDSEAPVPAKVLKKLRDGVAKTQAYLGKTTWQTLPTLGVTVPEETNDALTFPYVSDDGALAVSFIEPELRIDHVGDTATLKRTFKAWTAPTTTVPGCDDPECTCSNPASLDQLWADLARGVVLLEIGYRGTDTCWEPTDRYVALAVPRADALAGFSAEPRDPKAFRIDEMWAQLAVDDGPPDAETKVVIERLVRQWGKRFPDAAAVKAAQAKLAP